MNAESLYDSIDPAFGDPLAAFDEVLQRRIRIALDPLNWNELDAEERRTLVRQFDEIERELNKLFDQLERCEANLRDWKSVDIPTALDKAKRDEEVGKLEAEHVRIREELRRRRGDDLTSGGEPISSETRERTRKDPLSEEIERAFEALGESPQPRAVMRFLKERAGKPNCCIKRQVKEGVFWQTQGGVEKLLDLQALGARMRRLRQSKDQ